MEARVEDVDVDEVEKRRSASEFVLMMLSPLLLVGGRTGMELKSGSRMAEAERRVPIPLVATLGM